MSNQGAVISHLVAAVEDAIAGRVVEAARHAIDGIIAAVELVDDTAGRALLDEVDIRRTKAIADIAEQAKFGAIPALEDLASDRLAESAPPPPIVDDGRDDDES